MLTNLDSVWRLLLGLSYIEPVELESAIKKAQSAGKVRDNVVKLLRLAEQIKDPTGSGDLSDKGD